MAKIKTADLIGPPLDWATAQAVGEQYKRIENFPGDVNAIYEELYEPSTQWEDGGPLFDRFRLEIIQSGDGFCVVKDWSFDEPFDLGPLGDTHLIAACRAIVQKKFGDQVEVPSEIIGM